MQPSPAPLARCPHCSHLNPVDELQRCTHCAQPLEKRKPHSLQRTAALLATAAILYFPANLFPIMRSSQLGTPTDSTIIGGVLLLWRHGSLGVAAIIFFASVFVPIAKILSLSWLCWISSYGYRLSHPKHAKLYEITELLGRWSMIDVCVVAVLVSLVQLGGLLAIQPGPAGIAFAGVVISTMLAAHSLDQRLIWDAIEKRKRLSPHA